MISIKKIFHKLFNLDFYVSPADNFLDQYRGSHPGYSHSQRKEREKYKRIDELRDHAVTEIAPEKFWDKF